MVCIKTGKVSAISRELISFKKVQTPVRIFMNDPVRVTACTPSLLPAFLVKHTRERNKKLKAVDKICLKLCPEWRSDWLFLSLKSAALVLHNGCQYLPAEQICRERQDTVFSADFLMAPWI